MAYAPIPDIKALEAYIRQAALSRGIDPDVAVRVAKSEGLQPGTWQGNAQLAYGREQSYGPFQLHVAPSGYRPGLGNEFVNQTGLDPSDPANVYHGIDFALDQAKQTGWGPWFGAKRVGIAPMQGIGTVQPNTDTPRAQYAQPQYQPSQTPDQYQASTGLLPPTQKPTGIMAVAQASANGQSPPLADVLVRKAQEAALGNNSPLLSRQPMSPSQQPQQGGQQSATGNATGDLVVKAATQLGMDPNNPMFKILASLFL